MKYYVFLLSVLILSNCASTPAYEKKNYVKIGNTDPYSLKQTIDLNNILKANNFSVDQDKVKLLRVGVGGVDTFVTMPPQTQGMIFEKVSSDDEDFLGLADACSQKAAFEKVDTWALATGSAFLGGAIGAASASTAAAAAVAGPVLLLTTAIVGAGAYIGDQRSESIKRAIVMYACLAENGYQVEPKTINQGFYQ